MTRKISDQSGGTRPARRVSPLVALAAAATSVVTAATVAACGGSATGRQASSASGVSVTTRDGVIRLLNLAIPYPAGAADASAGSRQCPPPRPDPALANPPVAGGPDLYPSGCDVPLNVRIFNDGTRNARLTGVKIEGTAVGTATVVVLSFPTPTGRPSTQPSPSGAASASGSPARSSGSSRRSPSPARAKSASASASRSSPAASGGVGTDPATPSSTAVPSASADSAVAIDLAAGTLVMLTPGSSRYLAIRNLPSDLKVGDSVRLTFTFIYAGNTGGTSAERVAVPMLAAGAGADG